MLGGLLWFLLTLEALINRGDGEKNSEKGRAIL
jgi:hypothetical protein